VIPWTILLGTPETGASLFWLADGLDDGDLLIQERFEVAGDETSRSLYDKHCAALRRMLTSVLPRLAAGEIPRRPQDHSQATYCARRTAADGLIDWGRPARDVWTLIRAAGHPYPGAFTFYGGRRVTVWDATLVGPAPHFGLPGQIQELTDDGPLVQCGDGEHVSIRSFQIEGEAEETNPNRFKRHERFGVDWLRVIEPRGAG
jgi:methionyl-tRNA formyltransferase